MTAHSAEYVASLQSVTKAFVFARAGRPHLRRLTDDQLGDLAGIAVDVMLERHSDGLGGSGQ